MNTLLGLATTGCMLALVACSGAKSTPEIGGTDDAVKGAGETTNAPAPGKSSAKDAPTPAPPAATPDPGATPDDANATGTDGQPGRISVNEHCCYGATYFKCPNTAACFGGFDADACLARCADGDNACADACAAKEDAAGAPKGCQTVKPPKGIDCANGSITL